MRAPLRSPLPDNINDDIHPRNRDRLRLYSEQFKAFQFRGQRACAKVNTGGRHGRKERKQTWWFSMKSAVNSRAAVIIKLAGSSRSALPKQRSTAKPGLANWKRQHGMPCEMLELVSSGRPATRRRRTLAHRGDHPPDHARPFRRFATRLRRSDCRPEPRPPPSWDPPTAICTLPSAYIPDWPAGPPPTFLPR